MLNDRNISKIEGFLDKQQTARKIEVARETRKYSGGSKIRKRKGIIRVNTSLSRKLRRSLKRNPSLKKSLRKLIKCSSR